MAEAPARPPRAQDPPATSAPAATEDNWEEFSRLHDHCYMITDNALEAETRGRLSQAMGGYQKALDMMDQALAIEPGDNDKIATMQDKIRGAKKEMLSRLVDVQSAYAAAAVPPPRPPPPGAEAPPSYDSLYPAVPAAAGPMYPGVPPEMSVSPQLNSRVAAKVEDEQAAALMEIAEEADGGCLSLPTQAEELFSLTEGAQMFFVAPDGSVSAPSQPAGLRVCRFSSAPAPPGSPAAFLQVGDWTYPLIAGCSPVLHSNFGPYMFPDLERPGYHVALLLPESVSAASRVHFETLLSELTALVAQPAEALPGDAAASARTPQQESTAAWMSGGLVKGAELLSKGLVAGAGKLSGYMATGTQEIQSRVAPGQTPVKVDPRVQSGARTAKTVTVGALKVSEFVVSQVGKGTMALAAYIAPYVKRTGTRLLSGTRVASDEKQAASKIDDVLEVASGAVRGLSVVYTGLETAATQLAASLANNTVTLVRHRYGADVGQVTHHGLHAAGNLAMAGHNVQALGAKGIAKRMAKDTGRQLILEHDAKKAGTPG